MMTFMVVVGISSENRRFVALKFLEQIFLGKFPCNSCLSIQNLTFCWVGGEKQKETFLEFLERDFYWSLTKSETVVGCTSNENILGASSLGAAPCEVVYQVKEVEGDQKERKEEEKSKDDWGGADHHIHCGGRSFS